MRFTNNENIKNDITRNGYFNSLSVKESKPSIEKNTQFNNSSFNQPLNNNHLMKQTERFNTDMIFRKKEIIDTKDKSIETMNSEINKLKNSFSDVISKDKEIQELKNKIYLLNKDLQEKSGETDNIKELEIELKFLKKKLDEEYNKNYEISSIKNELKKIKDENISLRKKILEINQTSNLYKLKKNIIKHTNCSIKLVDKVLEENNITENSFLLNTITKVLIEKIMNQIKKENKPDPWD